MKLPSEIQEIFIDTLVGDKTILEFEQWLYTDKTLESVLNDEYYLDLISFGYKAPNTKYELFKLLEKHIDLGEHEKRKIRMLLEKVLNRDKELPEVLITFYDLYCDGYVFLQNLGLGYGLIIEAPYPKADNWDELSVREHQMLLDSFYPEIEEEVNKVIYWLENGQIILTGSKDIYNHYVYIDNRTEEERKWTASKRMALEDEMPISNQIHVERNNSKTVGGNFGLEKRSLVQVLGRICL